MRIDFTEITIKNFLSYGRNPTTLVYTDFPLNLVTAENGKGKSALLVDALFFALFGKPYRNIKIRNLISDINKRNTVVDLKFKINNKIECRIVRGLNPDFIEFYRGDIKEDSRSSKKLMQQEIDSVIQLNADTLRNTCILTSNQSKSFLDMKPQESRIVIENLFGIYVYSLMLQKIKMQRGETLDKISIVNKDIKFYSSIIDDFKNNFNKVKELRENFEKEKQEKLIKLNETKISKEKEFEVLKDIVSKYEENKKHLKEKIDEIHRVDIDTTEKLTKIKAEEKSKKELDSKLNILEQNKICPICSSDLTEEHKIREMGEINKKKENLNLIQASFLDSIKKNKEQIEILKMEQNSLLKEEEIIKTSTTLYNSLESDISILSQNIQIVIDDSIDRHIISVLDTDKIKEYIEKLKKIKDDNFILEEDLKYQEVIKDVLSDEGVKKLVIKRDLPFLNTKINEYLRKLGFNLNLELSDSFDLIITNPRKIDYEYNSFSNGQKKRIDLAILLSFIDLAKRKNSFSSNLLIFDEVLDTSLDNEGIQNFLTILNTKIKEEKLNIFIISHKSDIVLENCQKIEVLLDGEFSYLKRG